MFIYFSDVFRILRYCCDSNYFRKDITISFFFPIRKSLPLFPVFGLIISISHNIVYYLHTAVSIAHSNVSVNHLNHMVIN